MVSWLTARVEPGGKVFPAVPRMLAIPEIGADSGGSAVSSRRQIRVTWKKKSIWLATIIPFLFVSDILYGLIEMLGIKSEITPGIVMRGAVILIAIYMIISHWKYIDSRLHIWMSLIIWTIIPGFIIGLYRSNDLFFDLVMFLKTCYFPFITLMFVVIIRKCSIGYDSILRYVEYSAYVLGLSLWISQAVGYARPTYGDYAFGTTGIFYAQNDMTLAFGLSLLAAGYRVVMGRFSLVRSIMFVISALACVQIGTRASLAVVIGVAVTVTSCLLWGRSLGKHGSGFKGIRKWIVWSFVSGVAIATLAYGIAMQKTYSYQEKKIEEVMEGYFPRLLLVLAALRHIEERNVIFDVFGEGADSFQRGVAKHFVAETDRRLVEVDWLDIFGNYGLIFDIIIYLFVLHVLFLSSVRFAIRRDPLAGLLSSAVLLYVGHASVAGHALISPIPSTLAGAYFAIYFTNYSGSRPAAAWRWKSTDGRLP